MCDRDGAPENVAVIGLADCAALANAHHTSTHMKYGPTVALNVFCERRAHVRPVPPDTPVTVRNAGLTPKLTVVMTASTMLLAAVVRFAARDVAVVPSALAIVVLNATLAIVA